MGVALLGCGSVDPEAGDAVACEPTSVDTCGPTCAPCPQVTSDREMPTCDGTACGDACKDSAPECSDATCSRLLWSFTSGTLDGVTALAPAGLQLSNRSQAGNPALAADLTQLTQISFAIPICLSGTVSISARTFSFNVFFDGGDPVMEQYVVQASVLGPTGPSYFGSQPIQAGGWRTLTAPLSGATNSATTLKIQVDAGSFGAPFAGTIWFDDFKVE